MNKLKADRLITEYLEKIYELAYKKAFSHDEAEEISSLLVERLYISLLEYKEEIYNIESFIGRLREHNFAKFVSENKLREGISTGGADIPYNEPFFDELDGAKEEILRLRREILYKNGTFKPLTEKEKETSQLIMFADKLPQQEEQNGQKQKTDGFSVGLLLLLYSDNIIAVFGYFYQVCYRDAVKKFICHPAIIAPHRERTAVRGARAGRCSLGKTCYRSEFSLCQPQNLTHGIFSRLAAKPIAAALAVDTLNKRSACKQRHDLFDIFERNLLSFRYFAQRYISAVSVLRQIYHDSEGVSSAC